MKQRRDRTRNRQKQQKTTGNPSLACLAGSQRKAKEATCSSPQTARRDVSTVLAEEPLMRFLCVPV